MRTLQKIFAILVVLAALGAGCALYVGSAPASAVWKAAHGLKACDYDGYVAPAVDVGGIVTGLVDELMGQPDLTGKVSELLGPELGGMLTSGLGAIVRPMIGTMAEPSVKSFIEKCRLFGELPGPLATLAPLADFLRRPLAAETAAALAVMHTRETEPGKAVLEMPVRGGTLVVEVEKQKDRWTMVRAPGAGALLLLNRKNRTP
jgi:hypothetical protein